MATATTDTVRATVQVKKISWFRRYNRWARREEAMCCVTMLTEEGECFVTFTASAFVQVATDAEETLEPIRIEGKVKRLQEWGGKPQTVLSHVKRV